MKPLREQTLYEILEVPLDAPEAEIVKAWDRVTALYGPGSLATYTLMAPDEAELLGRRLDEAITILLDPEARKRYDARISGTPAGTPAGVPSGTPAPLAGRGEDGAVQRLLPAATEPRRLPPMPPPIIPPLASAAGASAAEVSTEPAARSTPPSLVAEAAPIRLATPVPFRPPPPLATPVPSATPAPSATPVPVSPPFAAVAVATAGANPIATPKPALPAATPPPRFAASQELVVPEGTRFSGDVLRRAREARGLTVAQICERTKITRHHIENLEADRHEKLPVPVYLRGILMALAKELRLDGQKVARSYIEAMQAGVAHGSKR